MAITAGTIPGHIVDANHTMEYLKCTAMQKLLTTHGHPKEGPVWLSSVRKLSFFFPLHIAYIFVLCVVIIKKKHDHAWPCSAVTVRWWPHPASMLSCIYIEEPGFLQGPHGGIPVLVPWVGQLSPLTIYPSHLIIFLRDEFFDISENTILDSQLHPMHFKEITSAIFTKLDQRKVPFFSLSLLPTTFTKQSHPSSRCTSAGLGNAPLSTVGMSSSIYCSAASSLTRFAYLTIQHQMDGTVVSVNIFLVFSLFIMRQRSWSQESIATCFVYFVPSC